MSPILALRVERRRSLLTRPRVHGHQLGWLVLLALAVGVCLLALTTGGSLGYSDERDYVELATGVARGQGYVLHGQASAFRPPVWPLVLAPFVAVGAGPQVLALVPALLLVVAALLAARVATTLLASRWGVLAGVAVLAYPVNAYAATTAYPQVLATVLVLALWLCLLHEHRGFVAGALAGLLAAALLLSVPTLAFTAVALLGAVLVRNRRQAAYLAGGIVGAGAPVLAWTVRNLLVLGAPVPISTSAGLNLLLGNSAGASADSGTQVDVSAVTGAAARAGLGEVQRSDLYTEQALGWVAAHPGQAAGLYVGKVANYFSAYNAPATAGQGSTLQAAVAWASLTLLVGLVVARLVLARRGSLPLTRWELYVLLLWPANAGFMAVFFTRTRFRQPLDAILLVEAALVLGLHLARRVPTAEVHPDGRLRTTSPGPRRRAGGWSGGRRDGCRLARRASHRPGPRREAAPATGGAGHRADARRRSG